MAENSSPMIYMKLRKKIRIPRETEAIKLKQIAVFITEPALEKRLEQLVITHPKQQDGNFILIDLISIIQKLREHGIEATIENYGEPHVLVEIEKTKRRPSIATIGLIWLMLFFGSGFAIMNFHADVSMKEVHQKLFTLITGETEKHPYLLQIPYSIGLGAGMVIFFNRWFKKKFNEEPNPLEVEMFSYEENVRQYVIHDEYRKMMNKKP